MIQPQTQPERSLETAREMIRSNEKSPTTFIMSKGDVGTFSLHDYIDKSRIDKMVNVSGYTTIERRYRFNTHYQPHVCEFLQRLNRFGLDRLLARDTQLQLAKPFKSTYSPTDLVERGDSSDSAYPVEDVDFSYGGAYSTYNWELFFHAPLLIATTTSTRPSST